MKCCGGGKVGGIGDYLCAYFCNKKAIVKNKLSMGDANLFLDAA